MLVNEENITNRNAGAYHAVSLFSNCGAGDIGYKKAGFSFDVMAEINPKRLEISLLNHPGAVGVKGDLRETWPEVVKTYRKKTKNASLSLLAACPPCQGMSSASGIGGTHDDADAGSRDERNLLAVIIANVALELNPKIIVVENVPEFLTKKVRHPNTNQPITASNLLIGLLEEKYQVFPIVLDMCDFGIPQSRKRSFLTFIKKTLPVLKRNMAAGLSPYPSLSNTNITLNSILRDLDLPELDAKSPATSKCDDKNLNYHFVPVLSPALYNLVKSIPKNSGRSAWQNNKCDNCGFENEKKIVECSQCGLLLPKPVVKEKNGSYRLVKGFKTSYKRMDPNKPAATVLMSSNSVSSHNTIHPYENRVLSLLECMKLQTFDSDFQWGNAIEKWGPIAVRKMIGEAVPPKFTQQHGEVLLGILQANPVSQLPLLDKRCQLAIKKLNKSKITESKSL